RACLPPLREGVLRAAAARRGLRLPADAQERVREGAPDARLGRDLRRAHEEGARPRLPHRRGPGASLPPHLRQEPVLQRPPRSQDAARPHEPVARAGAAPGAPAREGRLMDYRDFYRGKHVLVTGGLGFIGSNLCRALADLGAKVTAVDSLLPDYGGNLFNLAGYEDKLRINIADVRGHGMSYLVRDQDELFNLAGQVSHIDSMTDPFTDLEINCRSQLWILEALRQNNPEARVVYAGT